MNSRPRWPRHEHRSADDRFHSSLEIIWKSDLMLLDYSAANGSTICNLHTSAIPIGCKPPRWQNILYSRRNMALIKFFHHAYSIFQYSWRRTTSGKYSSTEVFRPSIYALSNAEWGGVCSYSVLQPRSTSVSSSGKCHHYCNEGRFVNINPEAFMKPLVSVK